MRVEAPKMTSFGETKIEYKEEAKDVHSKNTGPEKTKEIVTDEASMT